MYDCLLSSKDGTYTETSTIKKIQHVIVNTLLYVQIRKESLMKGFLRTTQTFDLWRAGNQNYVLNSILKGLLLVFLYQKPCKNRKCQNWGDLCMLIHSLDAWWPHCKGQLEERWQEYSLELFKPFSPLLLSFPFFSPSPIIQLALSTLLLFLL